MVFRFVDPVWLKLKAEFEADDIIGLGQERMVDGTPVHACGTICLPLNENQKAEKMLLSLHLR